MSRRRGRRGRRGVGAGAEKGHGDHDSGDGRATEKLATKHCFKTGDHPLLLLWIARDRDDVAAILGEESNS